MLFSEAAKLAKEANVKELWLTHYSPALVKAAPYIPATQKIFANTVAGKDGMSTELKFEE
jgi:ribonuclease Z